MNQNLTNAPRRINTRDPHDVAGRVIGSALDLSDAVRRLVLANASLIEQVGMALPAAIEAWRNRPAATYGYAQPIDRSPSSSAMLGQMLPSQGLPAQPTSPTFTCASRQMDASIESSSAADPTGGAMTPDAPPVDPMSIRCELHGVDAGTPCPGEVPVGWEPAVDLAALEVPPVDVPEVAKVPEAEPAPKPSTSLVSTATGRRLAVGDAVVREDGWYPIVETTPDGARVKPGFILGGVSPKLARDWLTNEELLASEIVAVGDEYLKPEVPNCPGHRVCVSGFNSENGFVRLSKEFVAGYRSENEAEHESFTGMIANVPVCALIFGDTGWVSVNAQPKRLLPEVIGIVDCGAIAIETDAEPVERIGGAPSEAVEASTQAHEPSGPRARAGVEAAAERMLASLPPDGVGGFTYTDDATPRAELSDGAARVVSSLIESPPEPTAALRELMEPAWATDSTTCTWVSHADRLAAIGDAIVYQDGPRVRFRMVDEDDVRADSVEGPGLGMAVVVCYAGMKATLARFQSRDVVFLHGSPYHSDKWFTRMAYAALSAGVDARAIHLAVGDRFRFRDGPDMRVTLIEESRRVMLDGDECSPCAEPAVADALDLALERDGWARATVGTLLDSSGFLVEASTDRAMLKSDYDSKSTYEQILLMTNDRQPAPQTAVNLRDELTEALDPVGGFARAEPSVEVAPPEPTAGQPLTYESFAGRPVAIGDAIVYCDAVGEHVRMVDAADVDVDAHEGIGAQIRRFADGMAPDIRKKRNVFWLRPRGTSYGFGDGRWSTELIRAALSQEESYWAVLVAVGDTFSFNGESIVGVVSIDEGWRVVLGTPAFAADVRDLAFQRNGWKRVRSGDQRETHVDTEAT